jgi:enoyl-CoA hydratase
MGVNGVEYFAHPWEWGARKAKELLFTGDWVTAADAHRLGMVNHVVPAAELRSFTMSMAERIATKPSFALKARQGEREPDPRCAGTVHCPRAAAFSLQHLGHAHNRVRFGVPVDPGPTTPR